MLTNLEVISFCHIYMYQIMLYTLNLYNVICQLYLNRIKKEKEHFKAFVEKSKNSHLDFFF